MESYIFHTDPGHGWLEVPRSLVNELGIADQISKYSYQKGDSVYLEEDCDTTLFASAYRKKYGHKVVMIEKYSDNDSFVRKLPRYTR